MSALPTQPLTEFQKPRYVNLQKKKNFDGLFSGIIECIISVIFKPFIKIFKAMLTVTPQYLVLCRPFGQSGHCTAILLHCKTVHTYVVGCLEKVEVLVCPSVVYAVEL